HLYVLDRYMQPVPEGVIGELCIGGESVGIGYVNDPAMTTEKFVKRTFYPGEPGRLIYKTGDRAKWCPDGTVEFLGRIDHQVKIRGYRIEVGEIENRLLTHEAIKDAVVIVKEAEGDKHLCAYIVKKAPTPSTPSTQSTQSIQSIPSILSISSTQPTTETFLSNLRQYLSQTLPEYMIPTYFISLEQMPLTPNGKIDKNALPEPENIAGTHYTAPRDQLEREMVKIWAGVLAIDEQRIGIEDNFFQLGGHSLKAATLMTRIHKELQVKITLEEIFKNLTVKQQARTVKRKKKEEYKAIEPVEQKEYYVLSAAQER
ncbi:MAG: AMP-binding protein, partial [bacterium]|nr:AMP-binding protein [bacterium]